MSYEAYSAVMHDLDRVLDQVEALDPRSITMAQVNDINEYAGLLKREAQRLMQQLGEESPDQVKRPPRPSRSMRMKK